MFTISSQNRTSIVSKPNDYNKSSIVITLLLIRYQTGLAALFGGLAILIACIGLFGLATYMAENRIKEIGVRKVPGAPAMNITALLSMDFVRLVLISVVIASSIAWRVTRFLLSLLKG
jgi:ABC-type antimicrobial peptide transport system permease subunit